MGGNVSILANEALCETLVKEPYDDSERPDDVMHLEDNMVECE